MTRTAFGEKRGDFGISAKQCPGRFALSIADLRPGAVHDSARHPPAYRLPFVRGHRSDRPDRTVRSAVAHPKFDLSHLRQNRSASSRSERIVAYARCCPGRRAAFGYPSRAGWLWPGSLDGRRRSAGVDAMRRSRLSTAARPRLAPAAILEQARQSVRAITARREGTARRVATKLGIAVPAAGGE